MDKELIKMALDALIETVHLAGVYGTHLIRSDKDKGHAYKTIEALRAALAQPEPEHRDVVIAGDLWRVEFLPNNDANVVLVKANYKTQPEKTDMQIGLTYEEANPPVAWAWNVDSGAGYSSRGIGFEQTNIPFAKHTPLYAAPPLAQPEPEPVAWMHDQKVGFNVPLYTAPPQREWVGLTYGEQNDCLVEADPCECLATPEAEELMRSVEAKLKEKNSI
jgi:hypothetical protein